MMTPSPHDTAELDEDPASLPTWVHLLRRQAKVRPERRAYVFLADGESDERSITFGELDQRARAIAALLQRHSSPRERALLLYPPGIDYVTAFFGCLYAGIVAVPAYPPDPRRIRRTL